MTAPEDGAGRDGPSDAPADEDPFEYTSDGAQESHPRTDANPGRGGTGIQTDTGSDDAADARPRGLADWVRWFWTTDKGGVVYVRDVLTSVSAVILVGFLLFAVSGIWPPMVAVESGSMEPNMNVGDLVFVVDNDRFVPAAAVETQDGRTTGVVPADRAAQVEHEEFGGYGDVVVYMPDGNDRRTPVIHRAMLWVEDGENWYERANERAVGSAASCAELNNCPAPHAGFITLGDDNDRYDQQTTLSSPVKPEWIVGTAELKIPYLGYVRLAFSGQVAGPLDWERGGQTPALQDSRASASASTPPAPDSPATTDTESAVHAAA